MARRYRFDRGARRPATAAVLLAVWAVLLALWLVVDAAPWIVAALLAATAPAAWDYATDRRAGIEIDATHLRWWSGRHSGDAALGAIDHVRLERRFDLSMRARLALPDGRRVALPQDALPPVDDLEQALTQAGIRWQRHPFSLL